MFGPLPEWAQSAFVLVIVLFLVLFVGRFVLKLRKLGSKPKEEEYDIVDRFSQLEQKPTEHLSNGSSNNQINKF